MAYFPHIRLVMGGQFFTEEIWSVGLRMIIGNGNTPPSGVVLDAWEEWTRDNVEDIATDCAAYVEASGSHFSSAAYLDYVKLNVVDENGRYRSDSETVEYRWPDGDRPRGTLAPTWPQLSTCVSLLTDTARGRANRGRYYVPTGGMGVDSGTGRMTSTDASTMAGAAQTFLNALNNQAGIDVNNPRVVVASNLGQPGPIRDVTRVAVGDVLDTQRRRRNALDETYTERPVTIV